MKILLLIGTGSFIGGISRFALSQYIHTKFPSAFPYGTLTVNILGCLVIGLVLGIVAKENLSQDWRLFLATGLIGGFTTFSAFSAETVGLLKQDLFLPAITYIALSVILGLLATFAGLSIVRLL